MFPGLLFVFRSNDDGPFFTMVLIPC